VIHEILQQVWVYVWGVWRFRWVALAVAWLGCIGGWLWVYQLPEAYRASARVYVDTNTVLAPLLRGLAIQPNINQRISLMARTMMSRPNLEKLMRMTDLDLRVNSDAEKEEMIASLKKSIRISGAGSNLYSISFVSPERDEAKRMVQALITTFIESTLGGNREDSSDAQAFLEQQIAEYEARMVEAEERLAAFKQRYVGTMPGSQGGFYARMQNAQNQLDAAKLQLEEARNRRDELKRQLAGDDPLFVPGMDASGGTLSSYDQRIQQLQLQRDKLLSRYTDRHPEVMQLSAMIADLEASRSADIQAIVSGDVTMPNVTSSTVYQNMRTMLAQAEGQIAELKVRVKEYDRRVQDLAEKVDRVPLIENELMQLDRDYGVIKGQHQALVQRRERAIMSQEVEENANDVSFRVIDPPFVPEKPTEPDKLLLNVAVLFASVGVGIGLAFLLSLLRPVIVDQRTLQNITGLPYLGGVGLVSGKDEHRKTVVRVTAFASVTVILLVTFAGVTWAPQILPSL
jgi:polysaccharide chain length determinant protein (PEP-CTERM system associated)